MEGGGKGEGRGGKGEGRGREGMYSQLVVDRHHRLPTSSYRISIKCPQPPTNPTN